MSPCSLERKNWTRSIEQRQMRETRSINVQTKGAQCSGEEGVQSAAASIFCTKTHARGGKPADGENSPPEEKMK